MAPSRTSWKGFLKLSLVSVPVKAFTANEASAEVHLNQLHKGCNSRIKYQKVCPEHGEQSTDNIVSGYEHTKGQYVVIDPDEVDIFGRPLQGLTLSLSGIYNPAKYPGGYLASDGTDLGGTQLTRSSKSKLTFSGEYAHPLTGNLDFVIGADATYRSKQSIYPSSQSWFVIKSGTIFNARIGVGPRNDNWSVEFWARNLTDEFYYVGAFSPPLQNSYVIYPSEPRTVGFELRGHW